MQISTVKTVLHILFVNNGYWKLLALVIAVLVYFGIRSDISHMRVVTVPVEVTTDSDSGNVAVWSVDPRSVRVSIRGSYIQISEIADASLKCVVRARQKSTSIMDTVQIKVKPKNIQGVRDARVVKIEPSAIDVKFDIPSTRQFAVAPPVVVGTARGTVKLSYDVTNAVVTGSRRLLRALDLEDTQIQTEPVDVDGRLESFTKRLRLVPPGDASSMTVDPAEMVVNVYIISQRLTKKIEKVPVIVNQPKGVPNRWETSPDVVDVEVTGRSEVIKGIEFADIMASVNGNLPVIPGLTNEVAVLTHLRQGLDVDTTRAVPEKIKLIPVLMPEPKSSPPPEPVPPVPEPAK